MHPSATLAVDASAPDRPELAAAAMAEPLGLVIAGAHARGVADALEALGLAAVLLDETGRILHMAGRAIDLCGAALRVDRGRLFAATSDDQLRVDALVAHATSSESRPEPVVFRGEQGTGGFEIGVLRLAQALPDASRRVKAALILSRLPSAITQ